VDSVSYGTTPFSYLVSRDDPWSRDPVNPCRAWERRASNADVAGYLGQAIPQTLQRVERVQILSRTEGGTPRELGIRGVDSTGATRDFVFTRPGASGKDIAGGHIRAGLPVAAVRGPWAAADGCLKGTRTPSAHITSLGFAPFTDDDGGTHEYATVWAHAAGIAEGVDQAQTLFRPTHAVSRAQMAAFLYRTFDVPATREHAFTDVDPDHHHREAIASVAAGGIAEGRADGSFRPNAPVTRAQMATFLARALGLEPRDPGFTDVVADDEHGRNVGALAASGITGGCSEDGRRYCPTNPVQRGQMTSFLHRAVRAQ
jgi:hypothetical protein